MQSLASNMQRAITFPIEKHARDASGVRGLRRLGDYDG